MVREIPRAGPPRTDRMFGRRDNHRVVIVPTRPALYIMDVWEEVMDGTAHEAVRTGDTVPPDVGVKSRAMVSRNLLLLRSI